MDDLPCPKRLEVTNSEGKIISYICNAPEAGAYKNKVKRAICASCPVRAGSEEPTFRVEVLADGTIVYERKPGDFEPPRDHKGYRRKSDDLRSDDAWVFIPEWPHCPHRELNQTRKTGCGCLLIEMTCKDNRSPYYRELVELEMCQGCPLMNPPRPHNSRIEHD